MTRPRSIFAGGTDYTGVGLSDIVGQILEWRDNTAATIKFLESQITVIQDRAALLEDPTEIERFVAYFIDLFRRYLADLAILVEQIPTRVRERHIELVSQLFDSSQVEEHLCIRFKENFVNKSIPHEEMRPFLDRIYGETRDQLIDFQDFSNLVPRLRTFIDEATSGRDQVFQLTPSFWGMGLNLRVLWQRAKGLLTRKRSK